MKKLTVAFISGLMMFCLLRADPVSAQTDTKAVIQRIEKIEERVKKIEASQEAILGKQEVILEQIKNLRVWIRRN